MRNILQNDNPTDDSVDCRESKRWEDTELSLFTTMYDTVPVPVQLHQVVEMIRNNELVRVRTANYRSLVEQDKEQQAASEKRNSPCFSVAVRFRGGKKKECLDGWTLLTMVDLDKVEPERMEQVKEVIRRDPHTLLHYTTISGCGHRVIAAYRCQELPLTPMAMKAYGLVFAECNRYYGTLTGCTSDEKCKNSTRLSLIAHDGDVYFNPQAMPFDLTEPVKQVLSHCNKRKNDRLKRVADYAIAELERQGVTYGPHTHNDYVMRMGYLMNEFGVDADLATEWAVAQFADYDQTESVFRACYQRTKAFGSRKLPNHAPREAAEKKPRFASVQEIEEFLSCEAEFRKNVLTNRVEVRLRRRTGGDGPNKGEDVVTTTGTGPLPVDGGGNCCGWKPLTDSEAHTLWRRICKQQRLCRLQDMLQVINSDFTPDFHPFLDYFRQLPPWDGHDYLLELMEQDHCTSPQEEVFFRKYFPKWLVGMVASLNSAETVNQLVLVLIGEQGSFKTTWLSRLLPPELKQYFNVSLSKTKMTKDDYLRLCENALVCLEELEDLSRINAQLKALITMPAVSERAAYARFKEDHPHWSSFCGTSNLRHFLVDLTGNRRFLPVEIAGIDNPYEHPLPYEGLYAQALAMYREGFRFYLSPEEIREVNRHNEDYELPCMERDLVQTLFQVPMPGAGNAVFLTSGQIVQRIYQCLHITLNTMRLSLVMKQLGYESRRAGSKRGYVVIELDAESINRNKQAMARYMHPPRPKDEDDKSMDLGI